MNELSIILHGADDRMSTIDKGHSAEADEDNN